MVLDNSAAGSPKVVPPTAEAYANMCKVVCRKFGKEGEWLGVA